ncbi:ABC transporter substrate-binding protein [Gordonia sp. VNK21]|uniref:ABC transporter substrate-binding protein n=1 Tax=Gordonia sp. VNK21 TaxID=3382483 RepID=UPI0038D37114
MKAPSNLKRTLRQAMVVGAAGALVFGGLTACSSDDDSTAASSGPTVELTENAPTGEAIKVGLIVPESGAISVPSVREGGEAAAEYLNANGGGVGGHKVELEICKEAEEPVSATKCANEMVAKKVSVVITPMGSQGAVMLPIVTGAGIPYVAQAPVSQVEMAAPKTYMLSSGIVGVLSAQAATAAKDGLKKVTVLIGDTGDAAASLKAMGEPIFSRAGVELKVVTVPVSVADPSAQIAAGLADKPDAVSILGDSRQCTSALKALQTAAPDVQKYLISSCLDRPVVEAVGEETYTNTKAFTTVDLTSDAETVNLYRTVMAKYAPDTDPRGLAYMGYQTVMALAEVGTGLQAGAVDAAAVDAAFGAARDLPLPAAPGLTFTCDGKAFPQLTSLCSKAMLVSDVGADLVFENTEVVNQD